MINLEKKKQIPKVHDLPLQHTLDRPSERGN